MNAQNTSSEISSSDEIPYQNPRYANRRTKEQRAQLSKFFNTPRVREIMAKKPTKYVDTLREMILDQLGMKISNVAIYHRMKVMREKESGTPTPSTRTSSDHSNSSESEESYESDPTPLSDPEEEDIAYPKHVPFIVKHDESLRGMTLSDIQEFFAHDLPYSGQYYVEVKKTPLVFKG